MKKILLTILLLQLASACSKVQFVYNENEIQRQLYNKTNVSILGDKISYLNSVVVTKFGIPEKEMFYLEIFVSEIKTKTSIEKNQVVSRTDYEIKFNYELNNISKNCVIFLKNQYSRFSFTPKSEGYNFGSDKSLETLYKRNIEDNVNQFIDSLSDQSLVGSDFKIENKKCLNED